MIKLSNVSFEYNSDKTIINNFNYIFNDSGLYGIVAKSGYGKTTLLNLIGGILKPSKGKISYSADIANDRSISYIFQDDNLLENLTLMENIEVVLRINKKEINIENIDSILLKLSILEYKNTKVKDISGGERKRLSIALALLNDSKVILADEPTSSLDIDNSINIMNIFKELSKDILIIFTCHNRDITNQFSDYILDLEKNVNNQIDSEDLYELQEKTKSLNFKTLFYLHKKIFKGKYIQFIFSIVFLTLTFSFLVFSLTMRKYDEVEVYSSIVHENSNSFIVDKNKENDDLLDSYIVDNYKNQYNEVYDLPIDITNFSSYYCDKNSTIFPMSKMPEFIEKSNLEDNHIVLTDYAAYYLKYYHVLGFDDINEIKGMKLCYDSAELIIDDFVRTEFSTYLNNPEKITYYGSEKHKMYFLVNAKTLKIICLINHTYELYSNEFSFYDDSNLDDNYISITSKALNAMGLESSTVGDEITFDISGRNSNKKVQYTFIIKEIKQSQSSLLFISPKAQNELSMELLDLNQYSIGYYFEKQSYEVVHSIVDHYVNKDRYFNLSNYMAFDYFDECFKITIDYSNLSYYSSFLFVLSLVISIIWLSYLVYSRFKLSIHSFRVLELYGMNRKDKLIIMNIDYLFQLLFSILFGSLLGYGFCSFFHTKECEKAGIFLKFKLFYWDCYCYSLLVEILFVVTMICVVYIISSFKKKHSHIAR